MSDDLKVSIVLANRAMHHEQIVRIARTHADIEDFCRSEWSGQGTYYINAVKVALEPGSIDRVLGFYLSGKLSPQGGNYLYCIGVRPDCRRRGVATAMMADMEPPLEMMTSADNFPMQVLANKFGMRMTQRLAAGRGRTAILWSKS